LIGFGFEKRLFEVEEGTDFLKEEVEGPAELPPPEARVALVSDRNETSWKDGNEQEADLRRGIFRI